MTALVNGRKWAAAKTTTTTTMRTNNYNNSCKMFNVKWQLIKFRAWQSIRIQNRSRIHSRGRVKWGEVEERRDYIEHSAEFIVAFNEQHMRLSLLPFNVCAVVFSVSLLLRIRSVLQVNCYLYANSAARQLLVRRTCSPIR